MSLTNTLIKSTFNRITGKVVIQDITDYAGQGVDVNTVTVAGYLKLEYDSGAGWVAFYNNIGGGTPDITPPSNYINAVDIAIPLDSDGLPLAAKYRFTYVVSVTDGSGESITTDIFDYEYTIVDPEICISTTVNCAQSKNTSVDVTNYNLVNVTIESLTKVHTLYPPPTSGLSDLVSSVTTLNYTPIANGTWTAEIIATVIYQQADGLFVTVELNGIKEFTVTCDTKLSKVLCCLNSLDKTYNSLLTSNPSKAQVFFDNTYQPTFRYVVLFLAAQSAGNATKAGIYYNNISEYSGCGDCSCNDDITIVPAENTGGNNQIYNVDSPTGTVSVVTQINGSTTTFHLEVSTSILNIINNIGNLVTVVSGDDYITVTPSGSAPKVFTVTYTGPIPHSNQQVQKRYKITPGDGAPGSAFLDLEVTEIINEGNDVSKPNVHANILGTTSPNANTDIAILRLSNFLTANKQYIASANLMRMSDTNFGEPLDMQDIEVEILWFDPASVTGYVVIRLYSNSTGQAFSLQELFDLFADDLNDPATGALYIALSISIEA